MSYRLDLSKPLGDAIRELITERTRQAQADASNLEQTVEWRVHELRKHCKKIRALLRMIRTGFPDYGAANHLYRDIARILAPHRDARVFANLAMHLSAELRDDPVANWFDFRAELAEQVAEEPLEATVRGLENALAESEEWRFDEVKPKHAMRGFSDNLSVVYSRSDRVSKDTTGKKAHEWRKCVKDHWYHLRIMRDALTQKDRRRIEQFGVLGELIGDAHDRDVFVERLDDLPVFLKDSQWKGELRELSLYEQKALQADAVRLAGGLLMGSHKKLGERIARRWKHLRNKAKGDNATLRVIA